MKQFLYALAWVGVTLFSFNLSTTPAQAESADATLAKSEYDSYIVLMEPAPAIQYEGDIKGYGATKPGKNKKVNPKSAHVRKYTQMLNRRHDEVLSRSGVSKHKKVHDYNIALNGFAARMSYEEALKVAEQEGVIRVFPDGLAQTTTDNSPSFLDLTVAAGPYAKGYDGEGIVVGIIDTGIWPEHPSFADDGSYAAPPLTLDETVYSACDFGNADHNPDDAAFTCNNKLIGARQILTTYRLVFGLVPDEFDSARDNDGHGTHTASTAAGNDSVPASILGKDLGVVSGIAPRAHIIVYKVIGPVNLAFFSDLAAAIDQAVADGVDVINYSISSPSPFFVFPDAVAFLFAASSGVSVAAANGNWGPGPGTGGSPATVPWLTAVGASTQDRTYQGSASSVDGWEVFGGSVTAGTPDLPLVDAADAGNAICRPGALDPTVVAGKIVLCQRGGGLWEETSLAVSIAGGAGMIVYSTNDVQLLPTLTHYVPSVHVNNTDGLFIKDYIANTDNPRARINAGEFTRQDAPFMALFSSRGPNGLSLDIIKPDITGPGVSVLAGVSPLHLNPWPLGELFMFNYGTSMSTPHVAGLFALLKQAHPDWTAAMAKSALMTTAYQAVNKEDNATPADPFDMGAGHVNPGGKATKGSAFEPGLAYDAGLLEYTAFSCGLGLMIFPPDRCAFVESIGVPSDASNLNLPSIGIGELAGSETVLRTVTSVANERGWRTYSVDVDPPPGYEVSVSPSSISLKQGMSATYEVTITNAGSPGGEWRFGSLIWSDSNGHYSVRSPIAVRGSLAGASGLVSGP